MAQRMRSALGAGSSPDGSRVAAGAAAPCQPPDSAMRTLAGRRPEWDLLDARAADAPQLERPPAWPGTRLDARSAFDAIIGQSPGFIAAVDEARKVAATHTTVLLTGESGTGKEVLARAIHDASGRAAGRFLAVNCAALPEALVESELFGHERGAFTGADKLKRGRFELAAGGTLFFDEIGELAPAVQATLLRVLQERQYERVGGTATLHADIRLIAATNRDLEQAVAEGRFREDLYYRVAVFRIHLPTLRERGDDVLRLADHFLRELGVKMERPAPRLTGDARDLLRTHSWPGNIRELQNAIERALILAHDGLISPAHLGLVPRPRRDGPMPAVAPGPAEGETAVPTIAAQERRMILEVLQRTHGHKERAAALLGLTRFQLYGRLKRYRIDVARGLGADHGAPS